jgi:uncharacterized protein (DUF433 family)
MTLPDFLTTDRYGFIHFVGHRIGLNHVLDRYNEGATPQRLEEDLPTLTSADIYAVLAFYHANKVEVDAYLKANREEIERQAAAPQPGPSAGELRRRMEERIRKESA